MGSFSPPIGGCASMQKFRRDEIPGFNLWIGDLQTGSGNCDDEGMYNELLYCYSTYLYNSAITLSSST